MSANDEYTASVKDARGHYYARIFHEEVDEGYQRIPKGRRAHAIAVHVVLARHTGVERQAYPSLRRIMELTGLSKPTVIDAIKELQAADLLKVERNRTARGDRSNTYTLVNISDPPSKQGLPPRVNDIDTKKIQLEEETTKKRDAASLASPDIMKNPFTFYCDLAKALDVTILPEDRQQTAKHFKDLMRREQPTEAELKKTVSKMLEARTSGFSMSPQKALDKVRNGNVRPLRPGADSERSWESRNKKVIE